MKRKMFAIAVFVLAAALSFSACAGTQQPAAEPSAAGQPAASSAQPAPGEKITMKISHVSSPGSARDLGCQKLKEVVEATVGDKVEAQVYPSSQLGGQRDQVEGAQFGTIECVVVPTSYLGGTTPMMTLLDTPYLLPGDPEQLYELYHSDAIKALMDTTTEKGFYTKAIWQTGYKAWTANKPLIDPAEMQGLKVRVMNSPILFKQAEILGASPITMDFSETYGALQNKALDGQENPIDTIYDMKFHEVQTDITITNHAGLDQVVLVNKAWFDGLPDDVKAAIDDGIQQGGHVCLDETLALAEKDRQLILDTGKTAIHDLTEDQLNAWKEAMKPVQEFARTSQGDAGAAIYDAIVETRKSITGE